jgi:toxin-antitoxin system PIN domain toxin
VILPDVNVLVYAFRPDAQQHERARVWLNAVIEGDSSFAVSKLVLSAFVRIVTNRKIYSVPTSVDRAFAFCDNLLEQPHCTIVEPGGQHWAIFQRLCIETNTKGNDLTDAWFAALAIEWGCEWVTFDRDFRRFAGLRCTILPSAA